MTQWTDADEPEADLIDVRKQKRERRDRFESSFRANTQLWWEGLVGKLRLTVDKAVKTENLDIRIGRASSDGHLDLVAAPEPYFEVKVSLDLETRTIIINRKKRPNIQSENIIKETERLALDPTPDGKIQLAHRETVEAILNPVLNALLP
jgi:hypothetical protein